MLELPAESRTRPGEAESHRAELIMEHLPCVRQIAMRIHQKLPISVSLEDLVSIGVLGLIEAVDRFNPALNVKLRTYAEHRIRGAILDSICSLDGVPAHKRARAKELHHAVDAAQQRLRRTATSEEVADELGISVEEYHELAQEVRGVTVGSLADSIDTRGGTLILADLIPDPDQLPANEVLERAELRQLLRNAMETLPPAERKVMALYYLQGLCLREIAAIIHLHVTRVSQLKLRATERVRRYVQPRWNPQKEGAVA